MKHNTFFQRNREIIVGAIMLAIAAVYLYNIQFIRIRSQVRVTARLVPEILGALVAFLAAVQIIRGVGVLLKARRENAAGNVPAVFVGREEMLSLWPVALTFVVIIAYAFVFNLLGFVIASTACMFLQMLVLTPRGKARPVLFAVVSVLSAAVIYLVFRRGLTLTLPQGILSGISFFN
ncbi:MAG: tripartite tricarboxylate transporter TctB family protein [Planctomycetota bacterium]|jgi:putative tricarboxylic transport membrane protein|nr:tripartite tricarboxylate transporter TctB family protein [Planctomycetota bacterium]